MPSNNRSLSPDRYNLKRDDTLTKTQAETGFFKGESGFRHPSNDTLYRYASGYHEVIPTDTYNYLRGAKDNGDGTHTLPESTPAHSFWQPYISTKVNSKTLSIILDLADGFRTDTAQTILSAPSGKVTGHSGSDLNREGQPDAHDLLRNAVKNILLTPSGKKSGISVKSVAVLFGAIAVTSLAPGELANGLKGGVASLKAGENAKNKWEANRNEMKRRVENEYSKLETRAEKKFVQEHIKAFLNSTQETMPNKKRTLRYKRATTPEREETKNSLNEVSGGSYCLGYLSKEPSMGFSEDPKYLPHYFTQPSRAARRILVILNSGKDVISSKKIVTNPNKNVTNSDNQTLKESNKRKANYTLRPLGQDIKKTKIG